MIKFFRRIRQRLLTQNRLSKYFFYAVGEIILVMIGILLALQVNNWNNQRQKLKKEAYYLTEILENLKSDTTQINVALDFNISKRNAIDSCFIELASPETSGNRMFAVGSRMGVIGSFRVFEPNDLGFSNMMSADNVELVRNDSIRRKLSVYYGFDYKESTQKRVVDVTRDFVDYVSPILSTKEYFMMVRNQEFELPSFNDIDVYKDPKFFSKLNLLSIIMDHHDDLLMEKKKQVTDLMNAISTELSLD